MDFHRTRDYDLIYRALTEPEVYLSIGDDYLPPPEEFKVNRHRDIWYVIVRNADFRRVGLFTLMPQNSVCWDVHAVMVPWATPSDKWAAARQLVPWLAKNSDCKRLTAAVPACNKAAIIYGIHGIGMRYVGRQPKAFQKHGELQDLILLGISVNGG